MTPQKKARRPVAKATPTANHGGDKTACFAQAMGENIAWLESQQGSLLQVHPEWANKYVAVASRTPSKILAVAEDSNRALAEGLRSTELLELAAREGLPADCLVNAMFLGTSWDD